MRRGRGPGGGSSCFCYRINGKGKRQFDDMEMSISRAQTTRGLGPSVLLLWSANSTVIMLVDDAGR